MEQANIQCTEMFRLSSVALRSDLRIATSYREQTKISIAQDLLSGLAIAFAIRWLDFLPSNTFSEPDIKRELSVT